MPSIYETMPATRVSKMIFYIPKKCRRNFSVTFFCQANASKRNSFISLSLLHFIANELFVRGSHEMARTKIIWIKNRNIHVFITKRTSYKTFFWKLCNLWSVLSSWIWKTTNEARQLHQIIKTPLLTSNTHHLCHEKQQHADPKFEDFTD